MIEVFIRSSTPYVDVGHYREMSQHTYCSPELVESTESQLFSLLKGRIIPQEDLAILRKAVEITKSQREELKVYDIARMADKLTALAKGIRKTPSIIVDGEKYEGLEKSLEAIQNKYNP